MYTVFFLSIFLLFKTMSHLKSIFLFNLFKKRPLGQRSQQTRIDKQNPGPSLLSDPSSFMQPMILRVDTLGKIATSGVKTSPDSIFWGCGEAWDDPVTSGLAQCICGEWVPHLPAGRPHSHTTWKPSIQVEEGQHLYTRAQDVCQIHCSDISEALSGARIVC